MGGHLCQGHIPLPTASKIVSEIYSGSTPFEVGCVRGGIRADIGRVSFLLHRAPGGSPPGTACEGQCARKSQPGRRGPIALQFSRTKNGPNPKHPPPPAADVPHRAGGLSPAVPGPRPTTARPTDRAWGPSSNGERATCLGAGSEPAWRAACTRPVRAARHRNWRTDRSPPAKATPLAGVV